MDGCYVISRLLDRKFWIVGGWFLAHVKKAHPLFLIFNSLDMLWDALWVWAPIYHEKSYILTRDSQKQNAQVKMFLSTVYVLDVIIQI